MSKYIVAALCLLLYAYIPAEAQKLTKNETDKFLKTKIKETSWEPLAVPFKNGLRCRVRSSNESLYIEFRIILHNSFLVTEGDKIYLLFDDDESMPVECVRGGVSKLDYDPAASFWYGEYLYKLTDEVKNKILNNHVVAARVSLGNEYVVFDKVKEKNSAKLRNAIQLVTK